MDLYVSPTGNDAWSGRLPTANAAANDGPLATPRAAQLRIRSLTSTPQKDLASPLGDSYAQLDGPVTVHLAVGTYDLGGKPWHFTQADSQPTTWIGSPGTILDGGRRLDGWQETTLNGVAAWTCTSPEISAGRVEFRQLFVNGTRAQSARWPKTGQFQIADALYSSEGEGWGKKGTDRFIAAPGDIRAFSNLADVEVLAFHYWIEERMPIVSFDPATNLVISSRTTRAPLSKAWGVGTAPYVLENVLDHCTEPGEFAVDRQRGQVWYIPRSGETLADSDLVTGVIPQLLVLTGDWKNDRPVRQQRFVGLTFRYGEAVWPGDPRHPAAAAYARDKADQRFRGAHLAGCAQGAYDVPGAIYFEGAEQCAITDCTVEHVGWYGIEVGVACSNIRVIGNTVRSTGAGGIRMGGLAAHEDSKGHTGLLRISDNHCHDGGHIFTSGIGVFLTHAHHCRIVHNHIHDYFYTGISAGWMWGYKDSVCRDHLIAWNHIHDLGKGVLSDLGGIYLLGPQPGTHVHHNRIHDITCAGYGGWAIYPDEGCSHVVIDNNVSYRTDRSVFHQHFGRENTIRNNIFAFGGEGSIAISKGEPHVSFTFWRNIVLSKGEPIYIGGYGIDMAQPGTFQADSNLFWDLAGPLTIAGGKKGGTAKVGEAALTMAQWQASGRDIHSQVADPLFADPEHGDFTLAANSPALALGFVPIDMSTVGPRAIELRV